MNLYQPTITGSLSVSGSVNISGSITIAGGGTISGTASIATNAITASSADNFLVRNTLTAQTLVVQTITSSVDFVTGSTRFGSISANTHVFSGSVTMNPGGLFVSSSGLVGIGNVVPAYTLDVSGTGRFTGNTIIGTRTTGNIRNLNIYGGTNNNAILKLDGADGNGYGAQVEFISKNSGGTSNQWTLGTGINTGSNTFELYNGTGVVMAATIGGNVGIGTFSPFAKLSIASPDGITSFPTYSTNDQASINWWYWASAAEGYTRYMDIAPKGAPDGTYGGSIIRFLTNGITNASNPIERMRITSGGNVFIGYSGGITDTRLLVIGQTSTSSSYSLVVKNSSLANLFYLRDDGIINTGTLSGSPYNNTSGAAANMVVNSSGFLERSTVSSLRYKENIKDWNGNGLNTILALKPKTFKYKKEHFDKADIEFLGLIAEEVAEVSPYLADYENEDRTGQVENVRYAFIVVPLIKAIQEMNTKLDEQNQIIQNLQEQINILAK